MKCFRDAHEWTCFKAQQAAEKALKAIILFLNGQKETSHKLVELANKVRIKPLIVPKCNSYSFNNNIIP